MVEWFKLSEFWYGTIVGGAVTLGIGYVLLLRKEAGEKEREKRQHNRQLENEARERWNDSIQALKDYLSDVIVQVTYAEKLSDPSAKKLVHQKLINGFPFKEIFRLTNEQIYENGQNEAKLFIEACSMIQELVPLMTSWMEAPSSDATEIVSLVTDANKKLKLR